MYCNRDSTTSLADRAKQLLYGSQEEAFTRHLDRLLNTIYCTRKPPINGGKSRARELRRCFDDALQLMYFCQSNDLHLFYLCSSSSVPLMLCHHLKHMTVPEPHTNIVSREQVERIGPTRCGLYRFIYDCFTSAGKLDPLESVEIDSGVRSVCLDMLRYLNEQWVFMVSDLVLLSHSFLRFLFYSSADKYALNDLAVVDAIWRRITKTKQQRQIVDGERCCQDWGALPCTPPVLPPHPSARTRAGAPHSPPSSSAPSSGARPSTLIRTGASSPPARKREIQFIDRSSLSSILPKSHRRGGGSGRKKTYNPVEIRQRLFRESIPEHPQAQASRVVDMLSEYSEQQRERRSADQYSCSSRFYAKASYSSSSSVRSGRSKRGRKPRYEIHRETLLIVPDPNDPRNFWCLCCDKPVASTYVRRHVNTKKPVGRIHVRNAERWIAEHPGRYEQMLSDLKEAFSKNFGSQSLVEAEASRSTASSSRPASDRAQGSAHAKSDPPGVSNERSDSKQPLSDEEDDRDSGEFDCSFSSSSSSFDSSSSSESEEDAEPTDEATARLLRLEDSEPQERAIKSKLQELFDCGSPLSAFNHHPSSRARSAQ